MIDGEFFFFLLLLAKCWPNHNTKNIKLCILKYKQLITIQIKVSKFSGTRSQRCNVQIRIIMHDVMNRNTQKSSPERGTAGDLVRKGNMKNVLRFLWKLAIVSNDFKGMGRSFHILRACTEKVRLSRLILVSGT